MGCSSSSNMAVHPLTEDEAGCKSSRRGDSVGSKGTADSGVVVENKDLLALSEAMPNKLPPLSSESLRECEVDKIKLNAAESGLLPCVGPVKGRPKSSEILEELWNQGIIPVETRLVKDSGAAYYIMDETRCAIRKPPARLESLKANKEVKSHSKEDFDEKIRLAEERRKLKQDELKTRLRTNTAVGRRPAPVSSMEDDSTFCPVESIQLPAIGEPFPASVLHSRMPHQAAVGGEWVKEAVGESMEYPEEKYFGGKMRQGTEEREGGDHRRGVEEEEVTQVEELRAGELGAASEELESESSFQHAEDKDKIF